jgi:hypothetical protein
MKKIFGKFISDVVGTRLKAPLSENIELYLLSLLLTITALQPCPSHPLGDAFSYSMVNVPSPPLSYNALP